MNKNSSIPKNARLILWASLLCAVLCGCSSVTKLATFAGESAGYINAQQAASINKSAAAVEKTFEDITPEQEYYIGRAVAATLLATYHPLYKKDINLYVNQIGQSLALVSPQPETFGGYHFLVLHTDEINAFAAPGGLILVSAGLIRCCKNEDQLAAVLAHEITHVVKKHGLKAIHKGRLTAALTTLASEGAKNLGSKDIAQLTTAFEGSIGDITQTLVISGYSRGQEMEADKGAIGILKNAGYDPQGLVAMLENLKKSLKPDDKKGFAKTHPDPLDRIKAVRGLVPPASASAPSQATTKRFGQAVGSL